VLVFVVENHSLDQMREGMPETFALSRRYGYATSFRALAHPSLPNYLAIAGGSTFGVDDDKPPDQNGVHGPSVFGQALASGHTARVYAEDMPVPCDTENDGDYAVRHNPWAYFLDERDSCARYDLPLTHLVIDAASGRLPNVGMAIPNVCNDAHDCDLATADTWLRDQLEALMAGPDWRSGHLLVVVTADEDDHSQDNLVLTAVIHPAVRQVVTDAPLTHFSLARLYEDVLGVPRLREAASARSLSRAFGLRLPVDRR
jgi:acid phosphatase